MKIIFRVVLLAALVAAGVWLWTVLFPSPEKIIRQRLAAVAKCASFAADEGALPRLADAENLAVTFDEGDAEQLPYPDAHFDVVMSMFGAMFAPRPEVAAKELLRVCRPGGLVAMANWTPEGFVGRSFGVTARHVPPPRGIPPPLLWGNENVVRQRFANGASEIVVTRVPIEMRYPFPAKGAVEFMRKYFGPTAAAYAKLDEAGQAALAADSESLFADCNHGPAGEAWVTSEYLEVHATRA